MMGVAGQGCNKGYQKIIRFVFISMFLYKTIQYKYEYYYSGIDPVKF